MTLVIMAAGMGSRFGGMKQLTPLTDEGEFIMDFTIYDAIYAGFDKFVIIIKEENEELFEEKIGRRLRKNGVDIRYAYQKQELPEGFTMPEGRVKPFGTGHAIMCAGKIDDNFGVVNADDCYGRDAFLKLASYLREAKDGEKAQYCMVGYQVKNTLSDHGTVSRGVCDADADANLVKVVENKKIERRADGVIINTFDDGSVAELAEDTTVSMNCFGFTASFTTYLYDMFVRFLQENQADLSKCEFFLPSAVQELIDRGIADVKVLASDAVWQGVTNRADSEIFRNFMRGEKAAGVYPQYLWNVRD
ncbi:MAG: nucleotidyltransferase [Clostridia bacterium]|nr:nucleotidyltransferase [Clostridia bacterium]